MKNVFILCAAFCFLMNMNGQNKIVCNFDHLSSNYHAWGNVSISSVTAPSGSLGQAGLVNVPANNQGDGIYFDLNSNFNKSDFTGIKLKIKGVNASSSFAFAFKLENTASGVVTQDWTTYPRYSGAGSWLDVTIPITGLQQGSYNRLTFIPAPYENLGAFSFYIDDVTLISNNVNSSSPTATINGNKFYAYGQEIFFNGINTAWQWNSDYRLDFLGRNYDANWWNSEFTKYVQNNINLARIWIHGGGNSSPSLNGDGLVTGASSSFWTDMDKLVALSKEKRIYIMPTFWSFDMTINNYNAVNWNQFRQIINDENKTKWYCEYFLVPFVQRYKDEPYVLGFDICNEPEHMWRDANCGNLSRNNVIRFLAICASYIHKNTTKPVTVGSMWIICNSDKYKGWTDQEAYAGNNYSESSLRAQYNDPDAYLDFYSPHWYQWQSSGSYFTTSIGYWLDNGNRPVLIGETPGYNVNENNWNTTLANAYLNAYWNGYSGVCAWKSPWENDGYGTFAGITPATNTFYQNYPNLVYPTGKPNLSSAVVTSISNAANSNPEEEVQVYFINENTLCITTDNSTICEIKLFTVNGQMLYEKKTVNQTIHIVVPDDFISQKVIIAQIILNNHKTISRKIAL
ncbi:MAG: cellulase family glycosylhydrolase [Candidatus Azobacteroides sp.]|nr:cellulase family glycosylhydrolase [Candidatus Azobacteroides sp.]